jgi:hypothetical protein
MADDADRKRRNTIKGIAKGLKGIKAISNTLGTSPTETPDVDTKYEKGYGEGDGAPAIQPSDRKYTTDENGIGDLEKTPKSKKKPQAH